MLQYITPLLMLRNEQKFRIYYTINNVKIVYNRLWYITPLLMLFRTLKVRNHWIFSMCSDSCEEVLEFLLVLRVFLCQPRRCCKFSELYTRSTGTWTKLLPIPLHWLFCASWGCCQSSHWAACRHRWWRACWGRYVGGSCKCFPCFLSCVIPVS